MAREVKTQFVADNEVNQLILLFILDKIEFPLTDNSLETIARNWLNYISYKEVLNKLIEFNFITKIVIDNEAEKERYKISSNGIDCLGHFYMKIPNSIREEITKYCKENRMSYKKNQEYVAKYEKQSDNSYTTSFKIISPNEGKAVFEIKMSFPTRKTAIDACTKWKEKAAEIYSTVFETLGE